MKNKTNPQWNFQPGDRQSFAKTITESDITTFAGLVGDFNPMHVDAEFARKSHVGRRTAHGMLAGGLISTVLHNRLPGPGWIYLSQQLEFLEPIYIGDTIKATVEVIQWQPDKRLITLRTDCHNQDDVQVVTGQAVMSIISGFEGEKG